MKPITPKELFFAMLLAATTADAAEPVSTQTGRTAVGETNAGAANEVSPPLSPHELMLARVWGLSAAEMQRASLLLKGPRAAFSAPNLTPIEALGIHARSDAERRKYAELFAKIHTQDLERVLAWSRVAEEELKRQTGDQPVMDWSNAPKASVTPGVAEAARVPEGSYIPVEPNLLSNRKAHKR